MTMKSLSLVSSSFNITVLTIIIIIIITLLVSSSTSLFFVVVNAQQTAAPPVYLGCGTDEVATLTSKNYPEESPPEIRIRNEVTCKIEITGVTNVKSITFSSDVTGPNAQIIINDVSCVSPSLTSSFLAGSFCLMFSQSSSINSPQGEILIDNLRWENVRQDHPQLLGENIGGIILITHHSNGAELPQILALKTYTVKNCIFTGTFKRGETRGDVAIRFILLYMAGTMSNISGTVTFENNRFEVRPGSEYTNGRIDAYMFFLDAAVSNIGGDFIVKNNFMDVSMAASNQAVSGAFAVLVKFNNGLSAVDGLFSADGNELVASKVHWSYSPWNHAGSKAEAVMFMFGLSFIPVIKHDTKWHVNNDTYFSAADIKGGISITNSILDARDISSTSEAVTNVVTFAYRGMNNIGGVGFLVKGVTVKNLKMSCGRHRSIFSIVTARNYNNNVVKMEISDVTITNVNMGIAEGVPIAQANGAQLLHILILGFNQWNIDDIIVQNIFLNGNAEEDVSRNNFVMRSGDLEAKILISTIEYIDGNRASEVYVNSSCSRCITDTIKFRRMILRNIHFYGAILHGGRQAVDVHMTLNSYAPLMNFSSLLVDQISFRPVRIQYASRGSVSVDLFRVVSFIYNVSGTIQMSNSIFEILSNSYPNVIGSASIPDQSNMGVYGFAASALVHLQELFTVFNITFSNINTRSDNFFMSMIHHGKISDDSTIPLYANVKHPVDPSPENGYLVKRMDVLYNVTDIVIEDMKLLNFFIESSGRQKVHIVHHGDRGFIRHLSGKLQLRNVEVTGSCQSAKWSAEIVMFMIAAGGLGDVNQIIVENIFQRAHITAYQINAMSTIVYATPNDGVSLNDFGGFAARNINEFIIRNVTNDFSVYSVGEELDKYLLNQNSIFAFEVEIDGPFGLLLLEDCHLLIRSIKVTSTFFMAFVGAGLVSSTQVWRGIQNITVSDSSITNFEHVSVAHSYNAAILHIQSAWKNIGSVSVRNSNVTILKGISVFKQYMIMGQPLTNLLVIYPKVKMPVEMVTGAGILLSSLLTFGEFEGDSVLDVVTNFKVPALPVTENISSVSISNCHVLVQDTRTQNERAEDAEFQSQVEFDGIYSKPNKLAFGIFVSVNPSTQFGRIDMQDSSFTSFVSYKSEDHSIILCLLGLVSSTNQQIEHISLRNSKMIFNTPPPTSSSPRTRFESMNEKHGKVLVSGLLFDFYGAPTKASIVENVHVEFNDERMSSSSRLTEQSCFSVVRLVDPYCYSDFTVQNSTLVIAATSSENTNNNNNNNNKDPLHFSLVRFNGQLDEAGKEARESATVTNVIENKIPPSSTLKMIKNKLLLKTASSSPSSSSSICDDELTDCSLLRVPDSIEKTSSEKSNQVKTFFLQQNHIDNRTRNSSIVFSSRKTPTSNAFSDKMTFHILEQNMNHGEIVSTTTTTGGKSSASAGSGLILSGSIWNLSCSSETQRNIWDVDVLDRFLILADEPTPGNAEVVNIQDCKDFVNDTKNGESGDDKGDETRTVTLVEKIEDEVVSKNDPVLATSTNALQGVGIAASAAAAAVVPSLGFGIARQQAMINFVQNMRSGNCAGVKAIDGVPAADSPTQMSIGESESRFFVGGSAGNFILSFGLVLAAEGLGAFILHRSKSSSWNKPFAVFARCNVALILFVCSSLLLAPTLTFGLVALTQSDVTLGEKILVVIFSLLGFAIPTFYYAIWSLFLRSNTKLEQYRKVPREGKAKNASKLKKLLTYWFEGEGEWMMPVKATVQENLEFDAATPLLEGYNKRAKWFGLAEFIVMFGLALAPFIGNIVPLEKSCVTVCVVLLITLGLFLLLCLYFRPFQELFNRVAVPIVTACEMAVIIIAYAFAENPPPFIATLAVLTSSLQSLMAVIVLLASLSPLTKHIIRAWKRFTKKSNTNNSARIGHHRSNVRHFRLSGGSRENDSAGGGGFSLRNLLSGGGGGEEEEPMKLMTRNSSNHRNDESRGRHGEDRRDHHGHRGGTSSRRDIHQRQQDQTRRPRSDSSHHQQQRHSNHSASRPSSSSDFRRRGDNDHRETMSPRSSSRGRTDNHRSNIRDYSPSRYINNNGSGRDDESRSSRHHERPRTYSSSSHRHHESSSSSRNRDNSNYYSREENEDRIRRKNGADNSSRRMENSSSRPSHAASREREYSPRSNNNSRSELPRQSSSRETTTTTTKRLPRRDDSAYI